ncbi:TraB/GumN family protein [Thioclava atlantica]|uniref:GumN family protein n=1 Tax=Thioclava atlantica TaxID=1317124 RepID=A0A085TW81_9RHOB|nr:TraB/GumN family protein [Thioclava atlantica]KFE34978.1 GumN family protein [Thioclava atlantica]
MKNSVLLRALLALPVWLFLVASARAECVGSDLFDAMPKAEQAKLEQAAHAAPFAQGLLFAARKDGQEITLAGTYHLPDPRHAALAGRVKEALAKASVLLVEAGPNEEARLQKAMTTDPSLMFSTGKTLPELLSEKDWDLTKAALAAHGMPAFLAAKMRPAFVAMTLSLPPCAMEEIAKGGKGLDKLVMESAQGRGVAIEALEPWDTVFTLFNAISEPEALEMLRAAVIGAPLAGDMGVTMGDLYFRGEPRIIWELARQQAVAGGMDPAEVERQMKLSEDLMMDARNRNWLPKIEAAAVKGPVVVAVGALHLSGEQGLLKLLQEDGWTITRLDG